MSNDMDEAAVIDDTMGAFRRIAAEAQLVFLALPATKDQPPQCVGYAFATVDIDMFIAMRRIGPTWDRSANDGEVPFAIATVAAEEICGMADWQASVLSTNETSWASQSWSLISRKYSWFKASHLDGDPVIIRLRPKMYSLLRYDKHVDRLWRTAISLSGNRWKVDEHAPKGRA